MVVNATAQAAVERARLAWRRRSWRACRAGAAAGAQPRPLLQSLGLLRSGERPGSGGAALAPGLLSVTWLRWGAQAAAEAAELRPVAAELARARAEAADLRQEQAALARQAALAVPLTEEAAQLRWKVRAPQPFFQMSIVPNPYPGSGHRAHWRCR